MHFIGAFQRVPSTLLDLSTLSFYAPYENSEGGRALSLWCRIWKISTITFPGREKDNKVLDTEPWIPYSLQTVLYFYQTMLCFGEGDGTPLQYSCLENSTDGGAWWATVHGVTKSLTRLSDFTFTFHFHALEKEMATHSSVLAWRIPGTGKAGGLPSMGSHRVGHVWSNLAAACCAFCFFIGKATEKFYFRSWTLLSTVLRSLGDVEMTSGTEKLILDARGGEDSSCLSLSTVSCLTLCPTSVWNPNYNSIHILNFNSIIFSFLLKAL